MRRPGIEPGARPWEDPMLPLHHRRVEKEQYTGIIAATRYVKETVDIMSGSVELWYIPSVYTPD